MSYKKAWYFFCLLISLFDSTIFLLNDFFHSVILYLILPFTYYRNKSKNRICFKTNHYETRLCSPINDRPSNLSPNQTYNLIIIAHPSETRYVTVNLFFGCIVNIGASATRQNPPNCDIPLHMAAITTVWHVVGHKDKHLHNYTLQKNHICI